MTVNKAIVRIEARAATQEERVLVAEVRRLQAMRCETCKHQRRTFTNGKRGYRWCERVSQDSTAVPCDVMGGGCLAWEKRDAD